ncbi:phosphatidate cytidylyltransferase [Desulfitobacterium sp.]|uniref:phosphatidate cytidylyltransferase n=1 Tax=Desulfitobacterium sp. TaxID=49981 RepID=UPI002B5FC9CD|nr:phosphatidate cytidylyltransferase [Desulfitobacterium sp.]HVJ47771.1 phosphatidate cytidylyltransferase [Desulfitobacterium sp.]
MLIRTISALIGAPLLLGLTYLGGPYTAFLAAVIGLLTLHEFQEIARKLGIKVWKKTTFLAAILWLILVVLGLREWMFPFSIFWLLFALGRMGIQYPRIRLSEVGYNFLSVIYTVVLSSHLFLLRSLEQGLAWAFLAFTLVWATDTFAYLIGRAIGRHPLAPQVSPNKTIEGSLGGLCGAILAGLIASRLMGGMPWSFFLGLSLIVGISAQIGDLFESAIKRSAGVKDSGHLIPGHGGFLDRFDSMLFAFPIVYYLVLISTVG